MATELLPRFHVIRAIIKGVVNNYSLNRDWFDNLVRIIYISVCKKLKTMRKAVILLGIGFVLSLSSCYRNSVCATYVKQDVKVEKSIEENSQERM